MREILFRAISMCKGEHWVYGLPRHYASNPHTEKWTVYDPATGIETDVLEETLSQYTGLTDKEGTRIFEGDIVMANFTRVDGRRYPFVITWKDETSAFFAKALEGELPDGYKDFGVWMTWLEEIEVASNIHDNSEMLKGGDR